MKNDIKEEMQRASRGLSVTDVISQLEEQDADEVIVISIKDDVVYTSYSVDNQFMALGTLDLAKRIILDEEVD
ncbi:hypothetical protein CL176_02115 [Suicoccus acidiformans]|uniref:Uncharacterized protein n=1 Tax=Suicoccus acidiformans TaxID=2036206 RepID=A0A347WIK7_9LACT|nr:hypothetical protein [Suicoccus acidiformans]AXY24914.1 hypothetical protein CL176_02115 [Suicoccus acidiformans]